MKYLIIINGNDIPIYANTLEEANLLMQRTIGWSDDGTAKIYQHLLDAKDTNRE